MWTLRKWHSRHGPTCGRIIAFPAASRLGFVICACTCSTLTHSCEAWNLTKAVSRILNGVNSPCLGLHVITGKEYSDTAVSPAYNLLLSVRQRRLRYLGHLLRLPHDSMVRRTPIAMAGGVNRATRKGASSWTARVQN